MQRSGMLRVEVSEAGHAALPAIDLDEPIVVIGSGADARVRLPASAAAPAHVRLEGGRWHALAPVIVDGASCEAGAAGDIGERVELALAGYRVCVAPAPPGAIAAPPQRTESLARELMRSLLGDDAAPALEVERGPVVGAHRKLAPPESVLVIGRGDEAGWILLDGDLSRAHAEVRRGWDGTRIVDLGSKNGTRVDGAPVEAGGMLLSDGALVELGKVALRFRDPAESHLRGGAPAASATAVASPSALRADRASAAPLRPAAPPAAAASPAQTRTSALPFYAALAIMVAALAGLVWVLTL